jgi:hypothetical protein
MNWMWRVRSEGRENLIGKLDWKRSLWWYGDGQNGRNLTTGRGNRFFFPLKGLDRLWDPPASYAMGTVRLFPGGVKRLEREAIRSPPPNIEVKNGGAIPLLFHMLWWLGSSLMKHRDNLNFAFYSIWNSENFSSTIGMPNLKTRLEAWLAMNGEMSPVRSIGAQIPTVSITERQMIVRKRKKVKLCLC